jgi:hypothetical protein
LKDIKASLTEEQRMNKKILASMIAGTMMISSASAVMADEPDKSVLDIDLESVSTVGDDAELKKSLEGILGYVTDENGTLEPEGAVQFYGYLQGDSVLL